MSPVNGRMEMMKYSAFVCHRKEFLISIVLVYGDGEQVCGKFPLGRLNNEKVSSLTP